jgi:DNA-binding HxlR family transcriptional regulator
MRPEYILVPNHGMTVGELAEELRAALVRNNAEATATSKWALPVVYALSQGDLRFSEVAARMGGATDKALVRCLKGLVDSGFVFREVAETFPPSVRYGLTTSGLLLVPELAAFAESLVE